MAIKCNVCNRYINRNNDACIQCVDCNSVFHITCTGREETQMDPMSDVGSSAEWSCGCVAVGISLRASPVSRSAGSNSAKRHCDSCLCDAVQGKLLTDLISSAAQLAISPLLNEIAALKRQLDTISRVSSLQDNINDIDESTNLKNDSSVPILFDAPCKRNITNIVNTTEEVISSGKIQNSKPNSFASFVDFKLPRNNSGNLEGKDTSTSSHSHIENLNRGSHRSSNFISETSTSGIIKAVSKR